ncbi:hypothetical protein TYRP_016100 [Tyrophagus putrescentiae]|nr:hypothetical protein TYRP_016100 [Tyrophagus putrescentiae]
MKTLIAVCLFAFFGSVYLNSDFELICPPNTCMHVKCGIPPECRNITVHLPDINGPKVHAHSENQRYRIIPRGGYCGCCDLCQKLLRENEQCPLTASTGMASSEVCNDGLKCDPQKLICVKA